MKLSQKKVEKISEHILSVLLTHFPNPLFTSEIAREIARDEEFTKKLLQDLESKGLVIAIIKNSKGSDYLRRIRWRLSNKAHEAYNKSNTNSF
jgi:DNA-binding MarR family transcriptional regulator